MMRVFLRGLASVVLRVWDGLVLVWDGLVLVWDGLWRVVLRVLGWILHGLSFEFLLKFAPNGGVIVFLRSFIVMILLYLAEIGLKEYLQAKAIFAFDRARLYDAVANTIPWFGAIFAGTYAALYTRFSSQWSYLANLYNQMLQVQVEAYLEQRNASRQAGSADAEDAPDA